MLNLLSTRWSWILVLYKVCFSTMTWLPPGLASGKALPSLISWWYAEFGCYPCHHNSRSNQMGSLMCMYLWLAPYLANPWLCTRSGLTPSHESQSNSKLSHRAVVKIEYKWRRKPCETSATDPTCTVFCFLIQLMELGWVATVSCALQSILKCAVQERGASDVHLEDCT